MLTNFPKFCQRYRADIQRVAQSDEHFKAYFDCLGDRGVRNIDMVYLNFLFRKKTIKPNQNVENFTQEREEFVIRDESLWNNNNFGHIFESNLQIEKENQHLDLHEQRIFLLEKCLKKEYHVKNFTEFKERNIRVAMISAASETVHRLWNENLYLNICLSNDMNDESRVAVIMNQLIKLTPVQQMYRIFSNICSCYQKEGYCEHLQNFDPELVILPHSIYYLSDEFINYVLDSESRIIFTAHVFASGTDGDIGQCAKFKCYMNQVTFNVKDDKEYKHKNFMPALLDVKNITTNNSVTKLSYWFYQENSMHCVGSIDGRAGKADFSSCIYKAQVNPHILGVRHVLQSAGNDNVGSIYVKEDKDEKFMVKMLGNSVQCINFRLQHFDFYNHFFSKESNNLKDDQFTKLTREFYIKYPEMCVEISNEVYNKLFMIAYKIKPEEINFDLLKNLFLQAEILIGNNSSNRYTTYVVLKNILYDVLTSFILVDNLLKSKIVGLLKDFPIKEGIIDQIANFFTGKTELDSNLNLVKEYEQTYNEEQSNNFDMIDSFKNEIKDIKNGVQDTIKEEVIDKVTTQVKNVYYAPELRIREEVKRFFSNLDKSVPKIKKNAQQQSSFKNNVDSNSKANSTFIIKEEKKELIKTSITKDMKIQRKKIKNKVIGKTMKKPIQKVLNDDDDNSDDGGSCF